MYQNLYLPEPHHTVLLLLDWNTRTCRHLRWPSLAAWFWNFWLKLTGTVIFQWVSLVLQVMCHIWNMHYSIRTFALQLFFTSRKVLTENIVTRYNFPNFSGTLIRIFFSPRNYLTCFQCQRPSFRQWLTAIPTPTGTYSIWKERHFTFINLLNLFWRHCHSAHGDWELFSFTMNLQSRNYHPLL